MEEINQQPDETVAETTVVEPKVEITEPVAEVRPETEQAVQAETAVPEIVEEIKSEEVQAEVSAEQPEADEVPKEIAEPKWFIVQTLTGQEDRVKERIETGVEELGLKDRVLRVLLPEEETVEIKGDKRVERKRKMYPGYVFIEMVLDEDTWYKIRSTAGVARFIGSKTTPTPVSDREMQRVLKQLGIKEKEFTVQFELGEPIRIISGSFRGYTGSVAEVNAAKSKLKAMINIFGRDTSVEVDFDRVEKVV